MSIFARLRRRGSRTQSKRKSRGWQVENQALSEARRDAHVFRNDPNMVIGGLGWTDQGRRNQH